MNDSADARRQLSLLDATCIMVGIVVGSGIFRTPMDVAKNSGSATTFLAMWVLGGAASLAGALCFAELSTRYPEDGGSYAFLRRGLGSNASFLFAWTDFWIVRPSNLGIIAITLADYAQRLQPIGPSGQLLYALGSVALATLFHLVGIHSGRWSQNALSITKVVGLLLVVLVAFTRPAEPSAAPVGSTEMNLGAAFVFVMFCYGGWSDLSYVAAEVKRPERNLLWALVAGVALITLLYVAVCASFLMSLGFAGVAASKAVAADAMASAFGTWGSDAISVLVIVSCFSALSSMVFTGARVYYALGQDDARFAWLGGWSNVRSTPTTALLAQAALACLLLVATSQLGNDLGGTFERLVLFNTPCYWGFNLLVLVALVRLRNNLHVTSQAFRVPLFPWTPIAFALACGWMVASSLQYAVQNLKFETSYSLIILFLGFVLTSVTPKSRRE